MSVWRCDGEAEHQRQSLALLAQCRACRLYGRLCVLCVEYGLYQQCVNAAVNQSFGLFGVGVEQRVVAEGVPARLRGVRCHRAGLARRPHRTCHEARLLRCLGGKFVGNLARYAARLEVNLAAEVLQTVVRHGYALRVEGVGFDYVGAGFEVLAVYVLNHVGARKAQQVVASAYVHRVRGKPFAAEVGLAKASALYHRAHCAVDYEYAVAPCRLYGAVVQPAVGSLAVACGESLELALGLFYYRFHLLVGVASAAAYAYGVVFLARFLSLVALVFLYYAHGLLHLVLVVEVHFKVHAVASDVVEQRPQLVQRNPACHYALASCQYLLVQVVPFRRATLRFSHARCPLYGVQFLNLEQCRQVVQGANAVQMVQRVVDFLALLTYEGLHEAAVVVHAYHGRYVAL